MPTATTTKLAAALQAWLDGRRFSARRFAAETGIAYTDGFADVRVVTGADAERTVGRPVPVLLTFDEQGFDFLSTHARASIFNRSALSELAARYGWRMESENEWSIGFYPVG